MLADFLQKALMLPPGALETPVSPGEISSRIGTNVRDFIASVNQSQWFPPGQPYVPVAPAGTTPRVFDYHWGQNFYIQPRSEPGVGPSFQQLRALADNCPMLRGVINTRIAQIAKMPWAWKLKVQPGEKKKDYKKRSEEDPRVRYLNKFFEYPNRRDSFQQWLTVLMEERFVTDALTVWPVRGQNGMCLALEPIDGATIKPLLNTQGWTPAPPDPAYQQNVKQMPTNNFTTDDLIYAPRYRRVHKIYGYGEVEQLLMTVNTAIRRDISKLAYYTDGNIPEMIVQCPATWTPTQILAFQDYFDSFAGDLQKKRRAFFLPESKGITQTKDAMLKDEYDEWLARIICYLFSVPPTPFIRQMNRATANTAQATALEEGLLGELKWLSSLFTLMATKYIGIQDVEFAFNTDQDSDAQIQANIDASDVKYGIRSVDEVREDRGLDPVGMGAVFLLPTGPILLKQIIDGEYSTADPSNPPQQQGGDEPNDEQKQAIKAILAAGVKKKPRLHY